MKIVLYRLFNFSCYNNERTLFKTNRKQVQGLHKTAYILQKEHSHVFSRNQFCAVVVLVVQASNLLKLVGAFLCCLYNH